MSIHGPVTATWLFMNFILLENCCWSGLEFGSSLEHHHFGTIKFFWKKFQIKIQISKISRCENNEKWLLKLSFLVFISVKKGQVKSHLRSRPDFNIDLIHFHYHQVWKSSENGLFWPEIANISNFPKFHGPYGLFSELGMKWFQINVVI